MQKIIILLILSLEIFSANQSFYEQYKNLIGNSSLSTDVQFQKGIDIEGDITVITNRYKDNIFLDVKIGDTQNEVIKKINKVESIKYSKENTNMLGSNISTISIESNNILTIFCFENKILLNAIFTDSNNNLIKIKDDYELYYLKESIISKGIFSPNKTYVASYLGIDDNEKYFIFRKCNFSEKDFWYGFSKSLNYTWLNDNLFIYTNNLYESPTIIDLTKKIGVNIEEKLGLKINELEDCYLEDKSDKYFTLRSDNEYHFITYNYYKEIILKIREYKKIENIEEWNHPLKSILSSLGLNILKIELIDDNTYPIITVENLPNNFTYEKLEKISKANGYWDLRLRDTDTSIKIYGDKKNKKFLKYEYK